MHGEKESARRGINANTLNQQTPNAKQQAKAQAEPKAAAPAIVRKVHIAMPAITVKRAATGEAKKSDTEESVETVYHDRDAEDAMSESSRWSGETEIPEKHVWFQEILDNDVSEGRTVAEQFDVAQRVL